MSKICKKSFGLALVLAALMVAGYPLAGQAQMGSVGSNNRNMAARTQAGNASMGNVNPGARFFGNGGGMATGTRSNATMAGGAKRSGFNGSTCSKNMGGGRR